MRGRNVADNSSSSATKSCTEPAHFRQTPLSPRRCGGRSAISFSSAGKYEVISGHRRLDVLKRLGIKEAPVIIKDLSDEEAVMMMVDSNLKRENILPSEKAFAYKMKLDAFRKLDKDGLTLSQLGTKLFYPYAIF